MSRTPGRRTDEPEDEDMLAVEDLELRDIGQSLIELGEQLRKVGELTESPHPKSTDFFEDDFMNDMQRLQAEHVRSGEVRDAMSKTLAGLRMFRGNYDYWERVAAEYALSKLSFTQRRTAALLGVGLSTVNRWAQNPVATEDNNEKQI